MRSIRISYRWSSESVLGKRHRRRRARVVVIVMCSEVPAHEAATLVELPDGGVLATWQGDRLP
jgi:hypothetical protein